jgi:hypothetical protein
MRNSLVVTPTAETIRRLTEMLTSSVLTLDMDLSSIELVSTNGVVSWQANPLAVYDDVMVKELVTESLPYGGNVVNCLVAYVESGKMQARSRELGFNTAQHRWVLKYDTPPGRSTRLTITHLTDVLVYRESPFSFSDEMLLQV